MMQAAGAYQLYVTNEKSGMHSTSRTHLFHTSLARNVFVLAVSSLFLAGSARTAESSKNAPSAYITNRPPLLPSALLKLPIGSIKPGGWLRGQLELEAAGMTGHLEEISKWCKFEVNAWSDPQGKGPSGWEELPYWLKGYGDLGYVLNDPKIIAEARKWIDAVLSSQDSTGWFGPRGLQTSLQGKPDLWPHMVMCNVLQSFYEYTSDERVLPFLTRYFKWMSTRPADNFGAGYWPKIRFGDNIETIYWLYNRTGDAWLLELARKIHENMARWDSGIIDWHNVNFAQGFREPGVYYLQAREAKFLQAAERNYQMMMSLYGQFPGGGFAGDENCRPGYTDPRQGFETCGMVEFTHSFEMLTRISGDSIWPDRCEDIAFNSLPAALTPDWKGLHYLTCANQVQLDRNNKAPEIQNSGTMFSYSPMEVYRCCQHNVSHGWPYYAEELWLATPDGGLCASLYAASEVRAKVGRGAMVTVSEETDYPFADTITLKLGLSAPEKFPLRLRLPVWCEEPRIKINGRREPSLPRAKGFVTLDRSWKNGDVVTLQLPMHVEVRKWEKNKNAVSVSYGPLSYSLKIGEKWQRYGHNETWPEFEVFPTTDWNYGLVLSQRNPANSFKVVKKPGPIAAQPFTPESAPIELRAQARKIPGWKQDRLGLVGKLQASPIKSTEPIQTVSLIPMGAARLRITSFPVIGSGTDAHDWTNPKPSLVSASHCFENDTVDAVADGVEPKNSNDHEIPRFTWWDHRGTTEWIQREFEKPASVSSVDVYWFDDTGAGSCRVPQSWRVLYRDGQEWKEVESPSPYATNKDRFNHVQFEAVQTGALRLEVKLQPDFSSGILEWKVK